MGRKESNRVKGDTESPAREKMPDFKKRAFWAITILIPLFALLLLEGVLQLFHYGGDLRLFIEGPRGSEKFLRINPEVARRYFYLQKSVPTPPKQLFLKEKPPNGYRIFVLGESSAAGFPYGTNSSFPNILERGLTNAFPEKYIEVVNVSMAAINSYALLDLTDEVLKYSPDLILIYTGHNEYYGAMGVGSTESLGGYKWLIRSYLKLQSFKTVLLMRDFVGWIKIHISKILNGSSQTDPSATLMNRMVSEQAIVSGSDLYEAGKEQFRENIEAIIKKAGARGVKIILSELVSNLRDQEPFISAEDGKTESARVCFIRGRQNENNGDYNKAKEYYIKAKDRDVLRFRAPEEFNTILAGLSVRYSVPLVPLVSYFEKESPHGIIGGKLMLEHLHPNECGYFLIAKAFYDKIVSEKLIEGVKTGYDFTEERGRCITELDSVYAAITVRHLKNSWPFKPRYTQNNFLENYRPHNIYEEGSLKIIPSSDFSLEAAHMELGKYYEREGRSDKALGEYEALIASIPQETEFYEKAATVLLMKKDFNRAFLLLKKMLKFNESSFAYKWLGQIELMNKNYLQAAEYLMKADPEDPQAIFNLSRAYYLGG
ncbi:MAG: hypothetical protein ACM3Q2_08470, partial [Syntrophothermus sp.]